MPKTRSLPATKTPMPELQTARGSVAQKMLADLRREKQQEVKKRGTKNLKGKKQRKKPAPTPAYT